MAVNLEEMALENEYYRVVVQTSKHQQLVVMSIQDFIPREIHPDNDQFIRVEKGRAKAILEDKYIYELNSGDSIIIPSDTYHQIINLSKNEPLKLYTIYSPPHHEPNTVHKTRLDDVEK